MDKCFFDVFPTLKVGDRLKRELGDVEVRKISTNRNRDFLKVHLFSHHLLAKGDVYQVEQLIEDQLFHSTHLTVNIIEEYRLSKQYTPEYILTEYAPSLFLELDEIRVER